MSLEQNKSEHLSKLLEQNEIVELKEKNPVKYELLMEKAHLLTDTKVKTDKLKAELAGEPTLDLDKKVDKLLLLIDETEKAEAPIDAVKSEVKKLKSEAGQAIDKVTEEAEEQAIGFLEKNIPWGKDIMTWIKKFGTAYKKSSDIFEKEGVIKGIFVFFGMLFGKVALDNKKEKKDENGEEEGETKAEDNEKPSETNTPPKINEGLRGIETKESIYSKTGFNIIKFFTPIQFTGEEDAQNTFQNKLIKEKKFEDLLNIYKSAYEEGNNEVHIDGLETDPKTLYKVLNTLFHDYTITLYKTKLDKKNIKDILKNKKINDIFTKEELEEIKSQEYNYKKLSFDIISKLLSISFKGLFVSGLIFTKEKLNGAYEYIISDSKLLEEVKEEVKERKENLLSENTLKIIKGKDTNLKFGGKERLNIYLDGILKGWIEGVDYYDKDKQQLEKFLTFRNQIINLSKDNKYSLGDLSGFENSYKSGLNLGKIAILYGLLNGKNINDIDSFERGSVYIWIIEVLRKKDGNNDISGKYESKLLKESTNQDSKIFSTNDRKVLKLLAFKILKNSENEISAKFTRGKDFIDEWFKELLPDSFEDKTKEGLIDGVETGIVGLLGAYLIFGKKNFALKFALASSGILGYLALFIAGKGTLEKIKNSIDEDDYKRMEKLLGEDPIEYLKKDIGEMLEQNKPTINVLNEKGDEKSVTITSLDDVKELEKGTPPEEINEKKLEGDYIFINSEGKLDTISYNDSFDKSETSPIFIKNKKDFGVLYERKKYSFDVGPNWVIDNTLERFDGDEDTFDGFPILYKNANLDIDNGKITFGGSLFSINMSNINEILITSEPQKDYKGRRYYVIKEGDKSFGVIDNDFILIIKDSN